MRRERCSRLRVLGQPLSTAVGTRDDPVRAGPDSLAPRSVSKGGSGGRSFPFVGRELKSPETIARTRDAIAQNPRSRSDRRPVHDALADPFSRLSSAYLTVRRSAFDGIRSGIGISDCRAQLRRFIASGQLLCTRDRRCCASERGHARSTSDHPNADRNPTIKR